MRDPTLELFGLWLRAAKDQGVQARLANVVDLLRAAKRVDGVQFLDIIFIYMAIQSLTRVAKT